MSTLGSFYASSVGKKVTMAVTGLVMVGFVVGHMIGNLKIFGGIDPTTGIYKLNMYAAYLREIGEELLGHAVLLWIARLTLIGSVIIHAVSAVLLTRQNRASKPPVKVNRSYRSATIASRTMSVGGAIVAGFIIIHILHFTTGTLHLNGFVEGAVYENVYSGFQNWSFVILYTIAITAVAFHLYHGGWSLFQTLGFDSPRWNRPLRSSVKVMSAVLWIGFLAVPYSVAFGILPAPEGVTIKNVAAISVGKIEEAPVIDPDRLFDDGVERDDDESLRAQSK